MTQIKFFFESLMKIVNLEPHKLVIFLCLLMILSTSVMGIKLYKKTETSNYNIELERNEYKSTIKQLEMKIDSLYIVRQAEKEEYLTKELRRSDSLLKESQKIQSSIKPLVKKINKKIDEVNN